MKAIGPSFGKLRILGHHPSAAERPPYCPRALCVCWSKMAQTPINTNWQDLDEEVQQAQKMLDVMEQQIVRPGHTTKARNKRRRVEPTVKWVERDACGYRIQDNSKPLRRESVPRMPLVPEMQSTARADESCFDPSIKGPSNEEMLDVLRQEMEELISDALLDDPEVRTIPNIASVDWAIRKSKSLERWKELRPDLIQYMLKAENTVQTLCSYCRNKKAVLRCQDCLPKQYYCEDCDLSFHAVFVLHNRDSMVDGFFMPIPPTTVIKFASDGKLIYEEKDCKLPVPVPERICACAAAAAATASIGKRVILITVNGRYSMYLPVLNCTFCGNSWSPNSSDLIQNGYWPASVSYETIYSMDLFSMFEDMKVIAPAMSLQAFTRTLERRTSHFGRGGKICDSTFQRSYLEWNYCRFEIDQLCHVQHFKCPACMPNMLAVSVDGNRKHYRFKKGTDEKGFMMVVS
ncbi:uncharacterized protein LOC111196334 isoform X1 [Astyanax mexicanus]|uniref:uncharacterized protein LOC111196334 isoform X1 n=2 Tax=Astyanax mexicanus TaxID=7994 RepID=UPI0020CABF75|nr:uncharacterized protein LOC111196334 isoform X1 [Astyanax mexicanus]XP_049329824.1 uncharacterized protein LOC111196334 isoform X1 [Astyanax mexicanus]XP_049329825.1 uncharacterized protein LOC111196334 isoform X1 [Astyanax mexicanus]XP_049329826.1 uncharacterized protein LOC111196334 isoform X1 [Astyanax mexicanus]XP_049329827.1 uncharacterized protein LOC111196334 isoform X1 [Astyanax mexicanus]XP_049329828.1 uncharacterized protein LOC111196334 isoform X1 [Astyanax mexicanus]